MAFKVKGVDVFSNDGALSKDSVTAARDGAASDITGSDELLLLDSDGDDDVMRVTVDELVSYFPAERSSAVLPDVAVTGLSQVVFTGIPSWATEIKVMMRAVSSATQNNFIVELGTSSGFITSGYFSQSTNEEGDIDVNQTIGFIVYVANAGDVFRGQMIISKFSDSTYVQTGSFARSVTGGSQCYGDLNGFSGVIDRVRIRCTGVTPQFDSGRIAVSYT